jgi:hypothetical protein
LSSPVSLALCSIENQNKAAIAQWWSEFSKQIPKTIAMRSFRVFLIYLICHVFIANYRGKGIRNGRQGLNIKTINKVLYSSLRWQFPSSESNYNVREWRKGRKFLK